MENETLKMALDFARKGWLVFPLHTIESNKCTCRKQTCSSEGKHPATSNGFKDATKAKEQLESWFSGQNRNIGIRTGAASGFFVLDVDPRNGGNESYNDLISEFGELPSTLTVNTGGGGRHYYFRIPIGMTIRGKSGFRPGLDLKSENGYVVAPPSMHVSGKPYFFDTDQNEPSDPLVEPPEWLLKEIIDVPEKQVKNAVAKQNDYLREGHRNEGILSLAGSMRQKGFSMQSIDVAIHSENEVKCIPPLASAEINQILNSVGRYPAGALPSFNKKPILQQAAYHGPIGELIRTVEEKTEAHPAALILSAISILGNIMGNGPHFMVGGTKHTCSLFGVLVGKTSKGRKGTAWDFITSLLEIIDQEFFKNHTESGLSSGEGVIAKLKGLQEQYSDARLLISESEFGGVLSRTYGPTNILSIVLREAWDGKKLQLLTKNDPMCVDDYSFSIVAHITQAELRKLLNETEMLNGLANRFLWVYTERIRLLPDPVPVSGKLIEPILKNIKRAVEKSKRVGEIRISENAKEEWSRLYVIMSEESDTIVDAVTSRGEPYVRRIAMIFALIDEQNEIEEEHLKAAYAIWVYCEESAQYIFGNPKMDRKMSKILTKIQASDQGAEKSELYAVFNRHIKKDELDKLLEELKRIRFIEEKEIIRDGKKVIIYLPIWS